MPPKVLKKVGLNRTNILSPINQRSSRRPLVASPNHNSTPLNPKPTANGAKKKVAKNDAKVSKPPSQKEAKKGPNFGYTTYLDMDVVESSNIEPTEEFVPNEFHNQFLNEKWNNWIGRLPKWMLDFELERHSSKDKKKKELSKKTEEETIEFDVSVKSKDDQGQMETENETTEVDTCKENKEVKSWNDWSIQLTKTGKLCITGKPDQTMTQQAEDVTLCKRVDANTLLHPDGSISILVGIPDHFTNVPYYVRNKFQCGFPEDWKTVKSLWAQYMKEDSPCEFVWNVNQSDTTLRYSAVSSRSFQTYHHNGTFLSPPSLRNRSDCKAQHDDSESSVIFQEYPKPNDATFTRQPSKAPESLIKQVLDRKLKRVHTVGGHLGAKRPRSELLDNSIDKTEELKTSNLSSASLHLIGAGSSTPINNMATVVATQEIVLRKWMPVLVKGSEIKITGVIKNGKQADVSHTTGIVLLRKSYVSFRSMEGSTYILEGPISDDSSIPIEIRTKLSRGLPIQWKKMVKQWASLVKASSSRE